MNLRAVVGVLGFLLLVTAAALVLPLGVALLYGEADWLGFLIAAVVGAVLGGLLWRAGRGVRDLKTREGFAVVSLGWFCVGLLGAVPFWLSGQIPGLTDAVFESLSGFSTTGASILTDVESRSHACLFWRSLTHWLGGMGIVVLALAILPLLGVGGMQLFRAEAPGPVPDRLTPRISETAKLLWGVYVLLTLSEAVLLAVAGMTPFDAICHAMATMATGGFSTRNASVGGYESAAIEWIVIVFMFLAGTNFALHHQVLRGKVFVYWRDEEFRGYVRLIASSVGLILLVLLPIGYYGGWGEAFRHTLFQVLAICTTTGFATADYLLWPPLAHALLLVLMTIGGCAGSTAGGTKIMRVMILLKQARSGLKKQIHPRAVYALWFNDQNVSPSVVTKVLGFFLLFILVYVGGVLILTLAGNDLLTSVGATAATLGNIGPGLGMVGPTGNYAFLAGWEKWLLVVFMLVGRLEIYTVLVLFLPEAWRRS